MQSISLLHWEGLLIKSGVAACFVTYHPDAFRFRKALEGVISQVANVYIVDNHSSNIESIRELAQSYESVRLVQLPSNMGIAAALNVGCAEALNDGFSYVVTLDQDTISSPNLVDALYSKMSDNVGVVGPWVCYEGNESFYDDPPVEPIDVAWTITSASLTNLNAWIRVKGFDESMFIDGVDRDFCIRLRRAGYRIVINPTATISHQLGEMQCKEVLGRVIHVTNHPPFRKFYIVRNKVYLAKKGVIRPSECVREVVQEFVKVVLFEHNKGIKLSKMGSGLIAGLKAPCLIGM